jgi:hypothetical protein
MLMAVAFESQVAPGYITDYNNIQLINDYTKHSRIVLFSGFLGIVLFLISAVRLSKNSSE